MKTYEIQVKVGTSTGHYNVQAISTAQAKKKHLAIYPKHDIKNVNLIKE